MQACIVKNPLNSYHTAGDPNELTQERSRTHASIVKNALVTCQFANNMNELT